MRPVVSVLFLASACSSISDERRISLGGVIETTDGDAAGTVHVSVHHGWLGEGLLRHPMAFIDRDTVEAPGSLDLVFDVPTDAGGEGLVVYAWHDRDGDGVLCSIDGDRTEHAGAVVVETWPAYAATIGLTLDTPCAGPETFVP